MFIEFTFANGDTERFSGIDRINVEQLLSTLRTGLDGIVFTEQDGDGTNTIVLQTAHIRRIATGEDGKANALNAKAFQFTKENR